MKFWLLILISLFATNLIQNANSVGEGGQESKLYKSFDEIFGKGWDDERNDTKDLNCRHVKEEDQDVQAPNISDQKNIDEILKQKFDEIYAKNWSEDENNSAPDQNQSVDEQQNESNKCEKIESDQQKWEIIQKFREIKKDYKKNQNNDRVKIEIKISNSLGVSRTKLYKWIKELGLSRETKFKPKFSEFEKCEILKQFQKIKSKCKKAKLKNISMRELDDKIAKKLFVSAATIYVWKRKFGLSAHKKFYEFEKREILKQFDEIKIKCKKAKLKNISMNELNGKIANKLGVCIASIIGWKRKFGLSVSNKKFSDETKIGILKKYAKIKRKNPKMPNAVIADMLKISTESLRKWGKQFKEEINNL